MFCYDWNSRYLLLTFWIILFKYRKTMRRFYFVLDKHTKEVYPSCELYPLKSYTDNKFKLWSSTFLEYNSINFKPQRAFVFTCMRVCLSLLSPTPYSTFYIISMHWMKMLSHLVFINTIKLAYTYSEYLTFKKRILLCICLYWFRVKYLMQLKCEHRLLIKDVRFDQRGVRFVVEGIRFRQRASTVRPTRGTARRTFG